MFKGFGKKKLDVMTKQQLLGLCIGEKMMDSDLKTMTKEELIKEILFQKEIGKIPKQRISKALKTAVWDKWHTLKIGEVDCPIKCGRKIQQGSFEAGHIIAEATGGPTDVTNLRPICNDCNKSMGTQNMNDFMKKTVVPKTISKTVEKVKQTSPAVIEIQKKCRYVFKKGKNEGEKCSLQVSKGKNCKLHQPKDEKNGCQFILMGGPNKGNKCGKDIQKNGFCKTHFDKDIVAKQTIDSDDSDEDKVFREKQKKEKKDIKKMKNMLLKDDVSSSSEDEDEDSEFKERMQDLLIRMEKGKSLPTLKERLDHLTIPCLKFIINYFYSFKTTGRNKAELVEECLEIIETEIPDKLTEEISDYFFFVSKSCSQQQFKITGDEILINLKGINLLARHKFIETILNELFKINSNEM